MKRAILCSAMVFGLGYAPRVQAAATCTVSGGLTIEPVDTYYCDTNLLGTGCNLWWEKDLDSKNASCPHDDPDPAPWCPTETGNAAPMRFTRVLLGTTSGGGELGMGYTDANGNWSITFTASGWNGCKGHNIIASFMFVRVHETDTSKFRFRVIEDATLATWVDAFGVKLAGGLTQVYRTYQRELAGGDAITSAANVYYTMDSAITKVVQWSTNLSDRFASTSWDEGTGFMRVKYDLDYTIPGGFWGLAYESQWRIELASFTYEMGSVTRHELGHMVHYAVHDRNLTQQCYSSSLGNVAGSQPISCEWGYYAMNEGLATFFGIRSITSNDTQVFYCACAAGSQDECSAVAAGGLDNDRIQHCPSGLTWGWSGIGDAYAYDQDHCARVRQLKGCTYFTDSNLDGIWNPGETQYCTSATSGNCNDYWKHGHRNETQITRFFWDVIDVNNEAAAEWHGHIDDTTLPMTGSLGLIDLFEFIDCPSTVDGACNEYDYPMPASCWPGSPTSSGIMPVMMGSRDAYNPYDFAQLVTSLDEGSATSELMLNCMGWAGD